MSVRITTLEFARYRGFRDSQCASLARLTLLYGENNAGKSAFVRVLPMLIVVNGLVGFGVVAFVRSSWNNASVTFKSGRLI